MELEYLHEVTMCLNARFQPVHRHQLEDALDALLQTEELGATDGGGTVQMPSGEIECCEIVLLLRDCKEETIARLVDIIHDLGVPKGSVIRYEENTASVGNMEGLALYLNGTDLSDEVYRTCDVNIVIEELERLLADSGRMYSYWEGAAETALYFYGADYEEMCEKIMGFLEEYPLCEKCRVEQIA